MNVITNLRKKLNRSIQLREWGWWTWLKAGFVVLTLITTVYAIQVTQSTNRQWSRAETFADYVARYQQVKKSSPSRRVQSYETIQNPLSFLEDKVKQSNLGELSPAGDSEDGSRYNLALEGLPLSEIIQLMRTFSRHPQIVITDFSVERIGLSAKTFDANFTLKIS